MTKLTLRTDASHGFTIIELLAVIAVIAIVAALLFPVFASARIDAQARVCTSNLHQLGLGVQMYAADWDDGMPFAPDPLSKKADGNVVTSSDPVLRLTELIPYDVRTLLAPYGCAPQVWRCPLDRNGNYSYDPGLQQPTNFQECGSSYWYDAQQALMGWTVADFTVPTESAIMTDYTISHLDDDADSKGVNLLFADFHVKIYTWNERTELLIAQGDP